MDPQHRATLRLGMGSTADMAFQRAKRYTPTSLLTLRLELELLQLYVLQPGLEAGLCRLGSPCFHNLHFLLTILPLQIPTAAKKKRWERIPGYDFPPSPCSR